MVNVLLNDMCVIRQHHKGVVIKRVFTVFLCTKGSSINDVTVLGGVGVKVLVTTVLRP